MKKYQLLGLAALYVCAAYKTSAESVLHWKPDGMVSTVDGKQIRLEIQGIYDALNYESHTYLAGFKIDKDGTNYPYIAKISDDLSSINYWSFKKIPSDIFIYQQEIHSVSIDGEVYKLEKSDWQLTELTFPPDSQVVYSDNNTNRIVCYPASLSKAVVRPSSCKSLNNNWQQDFVWHNHAPKMCDGVLYAIEQKRNANTFKKIDITTGKEISSSKIKQVPEDICGL